eukprot:6492314-Amphidinium_carterae.2
MGLGIKWDTINQARMVHQCQDFDHVSTRGELLLLAIGKSHEAEMTDNRCYTLLDLHSSVSSPQTSIRLKLITCFLLAYHSQTFEKRS